MELERKVSDSREQERPFWVATSPFFAIRYIGDPRYLKGGREETESREIGAMKLNVQSTASKTV